MSTIFLDFDDLRILSATPEAAILLCSRENDDEIIPEDEPCIVVLSRAMFQDAMNGWLDNKARYLEIWGEFAGVGYVALKGATKSHKSLPLGDLLPDREQSVDIYSGVESFEVDMEHG